MDDSSLETLTTELLKGYKTLRLSTAGGPVSPWICGAFFAEDGAFALRIALETHGKSLANVLADKRVAVMMSDDQPFGLFAQGQGTAEVVEGEAEVKVRAALLAKAPEIEPFLAAPLKTLVVTIDRWILTDVTRGWLPGKELRRG